MKILVVSDIHANLDALQAVLAAERGAFQGFLCLGDLTGYGPDPAECVDLVRVCARDVPWSLMLAGNHDALLSGRVEESWFSHAALKSFGYTRDRLTGESLEWLLSLSGFEEITLPDSPEVSAIVAHGSPDEPFTGYLWGGGESAGTYALMEARHAPLCFVGHTHEAAAFSRGHFGSVSPEGVLSIRENAPVIINPGSVGFPREFGFLAKVSGSGGEALAAEAETISIERYPAYYAVWDTASLTVAFRDARYDRRRVESRLFAAGL